MKRDNRIIYDTVSGKIWHTTGDAEGETLKPHDEISGLDYVDIEYGSINHAAHRIIGIDTKTKKPILESLIDTETAEQRRIRELEEDILLLQTENEIGGIL